MPETLYTIGHSTRSTQDFIDILKTHQIDKLADVRGTPYSRANPQFNRDTIANDLALRGIEYTYIQELGGRRGKSKTVPEHINAHWRNQSFHNFADHALTDEFSVGIDKLMTLMRNHKCAILCAEALWWKCHRRIIADRLIERGVTVYHIMDRDHLQLARTTENTQG